MNKKAVVLLSGGLDSCTCAAIARHSGFDIYALTIFYGQRHKYELEAAKRVGIYQLAREHKFLDIDLAAFGGSALTADIAVPKDRDESQMSANIPVTYVPARNMVFLSLAVAFAETIQAWDIFIGVNSVDYSGYPDCREDFIRAFENTANLATKAGIEGNHFTIHTPLMHWDKGQIIKRGLELGVDYSITHSCYDPDERGLSCGHCDACQLRLKGFAEAGIPDPIRYQ